MEKEERQENDEGDRAYSENYLLSFQKKIPPSEKISTYFGLKHPCERYGQCRFGDRCLFKDMPREWCRDCLAGVEHDECWGTQPETHPCMRVWGTCRFTNTCIYKNLPRIWCLFCLRGQQHTKCSGVKPVAIPEFIGKAVDKAHAKQAYKEAKKKKRKERQEQARRDQQAQAQAVAVAAAVVAAGGQPGVVPVLPTGGGTALTVPPPYQPPTSSTTTTSMSSQQQQHIPLQTLLASGGGSVFGSALGQSGQQNTQQHTTLGPLGATAKPIPTAGPLPQAQNVGSSSTSSIPASGVEQLSSKEVEKKLMGYLNKITPATYGKLVDEISVLLAHQPEETLREAAHRVHEKAIMEKFNVALYVDMIYTFSNTLPDAFRAQIINQCQAQLHSLPAEPPADMSEDDEVFFRKQHRQRDKGNITLIALLFKRKVVSDALMVDVVTYLITYKGPHVDDKVEDLCLLFTEAGQELETAKMVQQRPAYL
eukprot:TRINITY_DN61777_c0_g1_i1.p1 TRINITY_DN61777_c0_g1~~TRINITY_DN61777_c0_g1_i1.p1  ORF type:complete len:490 (-),score=46.62 TRINITY_DN61777_c0_g1_i1:56-1495(-)